MICKSYSIPWALLALLAIAGTAQAQSNTTFTNEGGGDWNTPENWDTGFVPEFTFDERALIDFGFTVTLSDVLDNTPPVAENGRQGPAAVRMFGDTTRLEILDGALLTVQEGDVDTDGFEIFDGTLNLQGTGQLVAHNFSMLAAGVVEFGVTGTTNFNTAPLSINGRANPDGAQLAINFADGAGLGVGELLTVIDAETIASDFGTVAVTGQELGVGQEYRFITSSGGNGTILSLTVDQKPILTVDRDTGNVSLGNPSGGAVELDAYTIRSDLGTINDGNFVGLPGSEWITSPGSANQVTQLRNSGVQVLGPASDFNLGNIYAALTEIPDFGIPLTSFEDIELTYSNSSDAEIDGIVQFVGDISENNLVVLIDSTTGQATMKNDSTYTIEIEAYTITSEGSFLEPGTWNSFDDQGLNSGNWEDSLGSSSARLTELIQSGTATITPGQEFDLGVIYDVTGIDTDILGFEFLFPPADSVDGDFNGDGTVNLADYTVWRDNLGAADESAIGGNGDGMNGVDAADYQLWKDNFGMSLSDSGGIPDVRTGVVKFVSAPPLVGLSAVPEPGTMVLTLLSGVVAFGWVRMARGTQS